MRPIRTLVAVAAVSLALTTPAVAQEHHLTTAPTIEEQRLDKAVPQEILRRSGFDDVAPDFARALA
ncbi:pyroglutamyl peptidase, partial [Streptomyces albiflaviniger]|nr:pyroglutamyl peptidase [Streptomyces albiflaviniger]